MMMKNMTMKMKTREALRTCPQSMSDREDTTKIQMEKLENGTFH